MAPFPDAGQDEEPAAAEPQQVAADGVTVRKVPERHGEAAVAIDFTIRSDREDPCVVRLTDPLPDAVRDNQVEFHPGYDPSHWRQDDDAAVYEAPIGPGVTRRTVYGIVIDDPSQVELFSTPPAVELSDHEPARADGAPVESDNAPAAEPFEFDTGDDGSSGGDPEDAVTPGSRAEPPADVDARLQTLREEFEELASAGRDRTDLDEIDARIEAVSRELEARVDALSDDLRELEARLEREERWRTSVRRTMASEPPEE